MLQNQEKQHCKIEKATLQNQKMQRANIRKMNVAKSKKATS